MELENISLVRLEPDTKIKPFDCEDADLNGFLFDDARNYCRQLLATTYLLENKDETVAYFNYLNDKISHHELGNNKDKFLNRISSILPKGKDNYTSYPAVKIGRLAVSKDYKGNGFGKLILNYTKNLFIDNNRTGCKFITVDAYRASLKFYEKNDFKYLSSADKKSDTRLMYYNLEALGLIKGNF